jgi:hypothetical protein
VPSEPFWILLAVLYAVVAAFVGAEAAIIAAAMLSLFAGATLLALRLAEGRRRRRRMAAFRPATLGR